MSEDTQVLFRDELLVQVVDEISVQCPGCTKKTKTRYRLDGESGDPVCRRCFLGWLVANDATVTIAVE